MAGCLSKVSLTCAEAGSAPANNDAASTTTTITRRTTIDVLARAGIRLDGARRAGALSCVNEPAAIVFADLDPPQPRVQAAIAHQFVVGPTLDDPSAVENDDQIRIANRGEAMRDHERRSPFAERLQRLLDAPLRFGVERAGRFVQDQNARVSQNGAGN